MLKRVPRPRGVFQGKNFMTPRILGYYKLAQGYAELSEGRGIDQGRIFGVTVKDHPTAASKLCFSRGDAIDYIKELS